MNPGDFCREGMWEEEGGCGREKVMSSHVENEDLVVNRKVQLQPEAGRQLEKGGGGGCQGIRARRAQRSGPGLSPSTSQFSEEPGQQGDLL